MHTLARLDVNGPVDLMHVVERAFPVRTNFFREQLAQSDHFHCSAAVAPVAMVPWTFIENKQVALKMRFVDPPPRKAKEKLFSCNENGVSRHVKSTTQRQRTSTRPPLLLQQVQ